MNRMRLLAEEKQMRISGSFRGKCTITIHNDASGARIWDINLKCTEEWKGPEGILCAEFSFPSVDISGRWFPVCGFDRAVKADYDAETESMTARSAPVVCFYNAAGENRHTIALSELRQKVSMRCGIHEEDGEMLCRIQVPVIRKSGETYSLKILESVAAEPYWKTLADVSWWWEQMLSFCFMEVPDDGRLPFYSFWYSRHQDVTAENVEADCRLAAEMGFQAVILDDGWQTGDNHRGYAFCGDWEPCEEKFPDFAAHVERVHAMGLKYLMWFSVPYIGKNAAGWKRFGDKILRYDKNQQAGILDLRYPEVRSYLKNIYVKAVRDWNVDGLKLDFIDEFYIQDNSPGFQEGMDMEDIQDALNVFLEDVSESLRELRAEILIEFRQKYIGPQIRRYGNLFRVSDCPCSAISNRVGIVDLRLLSGSTAVHSDMLMWHPKECVGEAALQIESCLFSTIQISVKLEELSDEMKKMLLFWMEFMRNHVELLQKTQIMPMEPENLYPEVQAETEKEKIIVHYSQNRIADIRKMPELLYYIHGTKEEEVCFRKEYGTGISYTILDCCGRTLEKGSMDAGEWNTLRVSTGGMVLFMSSEAGR